MTLVRWTQRPRGMDTIQDEFDSVLRGFLTNWKETPVLPKADWIPNTDIAEDETQYTVEIDLPGMTREEINIGVENGVLTVRGERNRATKEEGKGGWMRTERLTGTFVRTFTLPVSVDGSRIEATYKDGVLTLTLPKSEAARPKTIEVKVN